jgi:hypothetical protein
LKESLFLKKPEGVPWEYIKLQLCRDVYHCTPSQLDKEDADVVFLHLEMMSTEQEVKDFNKIKPAMRKGS